MSLRSIPAGANATVSQALSSVRSLAFLVICARAISPEQFGYVAIVTTAAIALNEVFRATASHPLALAFDEAPVADDHPLASAVSLHVLLSGGIGLAVSAVLLVVGPDEGSALVAGALVYGLTAWVDALRTGSINRGRADRSVAIDGTWTLALLVVLPVVFQRWPNSLAAVLTWGATAGVTAIGMTWRYRLVLSISSAKAFWQRVRSIAKPLAMQVALESVPARIAPLVIAAMVGARAAGSIRGAEVLLGVAAMVYSGVGAASLRQAREQFIAEPFAAVLRGVVTRYGVVLAAVGANLALVLILPDRVGTALLGDSWEGASNFAPVQSLVLSSLVVFAMVSVTMRACLSMQSLLKIDLFGAVLVAALVPSATALGGARLGLAMIAVAALCMALAGVRWIVRFDAGAARV